MREARVEKVWKKMVTKEQLSVLSSNCSYYPVCFFHILKHSQNKNCFKRNKWREEDKKVQAWARRWDQAWAEVGPGQPFCTRAPVFPGCGCRPRATWLAPGNISPSLQLCSQAGRGTGQPCTPGAWSLQTPAKGLVLHRCSISTDKWGEKTMLGPSLPPSTCH